MTILDIPHHYIAVEGPIGVGKTHLVKRLAESFSATTVLEQPENNPFLEKFYITISIAHTIKFFNATGALEQRIATR